MMLDLRKNCCGFGVRFVTVVKTSPKATHMKPTSFPFHHGLPCPKTFRPASRRRLVSETTSFHCSLSICESFHCSLTSPRPAGDFLHTHGSFCLGTKLNKTGPLGALSPQFFFLSTLNTHEPALGGFYCTRTGRNQQIVSISSFYLRSAAAELM